MSVATSTAIAIAGGVAAAGAVGGAAISAHEQSKATTQAVDQQSQAAANSLAFNQHVFNTDQQNEQPYMQAGQGAVNTLQSDSGALLQPWTTPFSFSGVNLQNDPAYQFDLTQGQQAIERSAAAQGGLVSGGELKDLNDYSQGYASNQFQQSYANALGQYQQAYQIFQNNQSNTFNRLSSIASLGQNAAAGTASAGAAAAGTNASVNTNTANSLSNLETGQGNAQAASTLAATNGISNAANMFANYSLQTGSSYGKGSGYGPAGPPPPGTGGQYG